jgi:glycosyltransferase involved in cell wall biosynthesis
MRPGVTAALIVRNEEAFLEGCLLSLAGHVDEIVIVDTGSADRTVAIAESFGALVLHQPWRDDFATPRNLGLDAATCDWILYIDADERLSVPDGARLDDGLRQPGIVAARVRFVPRSNATAHRELRLFRNDPRIRFESAIHETVVPSVDALVAGGGRVVHSPAAITHLGYEGDLTRKYRRNIPMLRAAVAAEPERLYFWHDLGESLAGLGDDAGAIEAFGNGLAMARRKARPNDVASLLAFGLARLMRAAGNDSMAVVEEGLAFYPGQRALLFLKARILADRGDNEAALAIADRLRFADGPGFEDATLSYDVRIFGAFAHDLAGIVLLRMGKREEAAAAFTLAAAAAPDEPSYRIKAAAISARPRASGG